MSDVLQATIADLDGIAALHHQTTLLHHRTLPDVIKKTTLEMEKAFLKPYFEEEGVVFFKTIDGNLICGYLILRINTLPEDFFVDPRQGYIESMGVDACYQRQGIGQALISAAESYAKTQGIRVIGMDFSLFNHPANKLYEKMGYEPWMAYKRKVL